MTPKIRQNLRKGNVNISILTDEIEDNNDKQLLKNKKQKKITTKKPSLRVQLGILTVPVLKNILRLNHQNPFGNKPDLISRILYLTKHGGYPRCPKCIQGRLKQRVHRRKDQSKYYCPGFPIGFRAPASYHYCDYVTDECKKEIFYFPPALKLTIEK